MKMNNIIYMLCSHISLTSLLVYILLCICHLGSFPNLHNFIESLKQLGICRQINHTEDGTTLILSYFK